MALTRLTEPALLADQVFGAIQDAILSGAIPAGSRLRIRNLADELGTSPMPVRDALVRLEQTGLAQRVPHKGAVVTELRPAELVSIYDTRLLLEREAARLGSQQLTSAEGTRMRSEHTRMQRAVRAGRWAEALDHDETLLTVLYTAAGNHVLLDLIQSLWRRCRAYKLFGVQRAHDADAGAWGHQERLITASLAHDTATAVAVTEESLTRSIVRIRAMLD